MPAPQVVHEKPPACAPGAGGGVFTPGSWVWTVKIRFELGKKMARISCAMLPSGGKTRAWVADAVVAAARGAAGQVIPLKAVSADASSVPPAGKPPVFRM